jgi:proteasome lid subunit RPN8/RPN11
METVTIARGAVDAMVAHAREAAPAECCGVLLGRDGIVGAAVRTANAAEDVRRRYLIDPQDHITILRDARARGLAVVGFYHSHPRGSADASPSDIAEASYPEHLYAIVGLMREPFELRVYRSEETGFREVEPVTVDEA